MELTVAGITKEQFDSESKWVINFTDRPRVVGTYPRLKKMFGNDFWSNDNVRDVDLLDYESQPESLRSFFETVEEIDRIYGRMNITDIFKEFGDCCVG